MLKQIAIALAVVLSPVTLASASPDQVTAVKSGLMTAREHLLAMLDAADAPSRDKHGTEVVKATKSVDTSLSAALADKGNVPDVATKLQEFKTTWEAFKKTRDGEIIPALKANDKPKAVSLAKGIQAERFKKLTELLGALGAK